MRKILPLKLALSQLCNFRSFLSSTFNPLHNDLTDFFGYVFDVHFDCSRVVDPTVPWFRDIII